MAKEPVAAYRTSRMNALRSDLKQLVDKVDNEDMLTYCLDYLGRAGQCDTDDEIRENIVSACNDVNRRKAGQEKFKSAHALLDEIRNM